MLTLASLALALPLQAPRTPVDIATAQSAVMGDPEVASIGDHVVTAWRTFGSESVFLSTSDGCGLAWSQAVELDLTPGAAELEGLQIALYGDTAVLAWDDSRFHPGATFSEPGSAPFLTTFDLLTGALGAEVELPVLGAIDQVETTIEEVIAIEVDGAAHVHVLLYSESFGTANYRWILASSHDGGASFPFTHEIADGLIFYEDDAELVVDGNTVHVVFDASEMTLGPVEVRHQRSSDAGASLDFAAPVTLTTLPPDVSMKRMVARGADGQVLVAWVDQEVVSSKPFNLTERLLSVMSNDGGDNFSAPVIIDQVTSPWDRFYIEDALVEPASGNGIVVWSTSNTDAFDSANLLSTSTDSGATWSLPNQWSYGFGAGYLGLVGDSADRERVIAVAGFVDPFGFEDFYEAVAAVSLDGGVTFEETVDLSIPGRTLTGAAFNERYQNLVATLRPVDATQIDAGGLRPQALQLEGFVPGPTQADVSFAGFDDGNSIAWVLLSTQLGDLPLPLGDNRNTGLGLSNFLLTTINLAGAGQLETSLDATGAGALAPISVSFPAGLTLHAVGFTIDLGTLGFGDISDVVTVAL